MLVQLLIKLERPEICAGIYTGFVFILNLIFGEGFVGILVATAISGVLSFGYFWLLNQTLNTVYFWIVLIVGLAIGVI